MKRLFLLISILLLYVCSFSQTLSHITLSGGKTLSAFSFLTDQRVIINISQDGKVLEWGTEMETFRFNYYPGKLLPYMGRVEYYGPGTDSAFRGKVKSIGTCILRYYGLMESEEKTGKLKSIGSVPLDYYSYMENESFRGKLRSAGTVSLSYYSFFDNEAYRGNLKSVSNISLTYYSTFDDKLIKGKIKSIGMFNYAWYSSFDRREFRGSLKSGSISQQINGIIYIVR